MTLLLSYMVAIAKDCAPPSTEWCMRKPKLTMSCRRFSFRCGKKPVVIHRKLANHSDGWSRLHGGAPSTGCDGVRLILVRENATKGESSRSRRFPVAMPQRHLC